MNQARTQWTLTALAAVVAVLVTLLVVQYLRDGSRYAFGQVSEGAAGYVVGVVGPEYQNRLPLFLIDNKSQTILVYEYYQPNRELFLRAARTFRYDRDVEDESFTKYGTSKGPSVKDVQDFLGQSGGGNRRY